MTDIVLGITLKADASGFTGQVKLGQGELERLGKTAEETGRRGAQGTDFFSRSLGSLKAQIIGAAGAYLSLRGAAAAIRFGFDALKAAGDIGELAQQVGLTAEQLQIYQFGAAQAGVESEQLAVSIQFLTRTIGDAASGNDVAIESFDRLGVRILDAEGKIRPTGDILRDIAEALSRIEDPAIRAARAQDLFGRGGQRLLPLLANGARGLDELGRAAHQAGVVLTDEMVKTADEAADKIVALEFQWEKFSQRMVIEFVPAITAALERMNDSNFFDPSKGMTTLDAIRSLLGRDPGIMGGSSRGGPPPPHTAPPGTLGAANPPPAGAGDELTKRLAERAEIVRQFHLEQVIQQEEDLRKAFERSAVMLKEKADATRAAADADSQLGETIRQSLLTPQEQYNESLAEYRRLLTDGAISQDTFGRAAKAAGEELAAANDNAGSLGDTMKVVSQQAVHAFEDWLATGGDVHDMLGALEEDLIRLASRALIFDPLEKAVGGIDFGSIFGRIFGAIFGASGPGPGAGPEVRHAGGVVGSAGAPRRRMPAAVFAHAPRYHAGGMLGPDEVPIVGKRGEVIGWPQQMRQAFGGGDTQVVINNYSGQSGRAEERQGGDGRRLIEVTIGEAVGKDLRNRGAVAQQLEQTYGLARRGRVNG